MRRFVYSPRVDAWVKTDWGIVDISPFIVSGSITRRVNQVSSASLVLRNPDFRWTNRRVLLRPDPQTGERVEEVQPVFHPMDAITITLTRLKDHPVQVFTGYLDKTPYIELYPGTVTLEASCTLKRILHTYWDPAVPASLQLLKDNGWIIGRDGQFINPGALQGGQSQQDSSFGKLLEQILIRVGGWHSPNIHIGKIPDNLPASVAKIAQNIQTQDEAAMKEIDSFLSRIIGPGTYGTGGVTSGTPGSTPGGSVPTGTVTGEDKITQKLCEIARQYNIPPELAIATWLIEWGDAGNKDDPGNPNHTGYFQAQNQEAGGSNPYAYGPWSHHVPTVAETHDLGLAGAAFAAAAAGWLAHDPSLKGNPRQWAMDTQGVTCSNNPHYCDGTFERNLSRAKEMLSKYGCGNSGLDPNSPANSTAPNAAGPNKATGRAADQIRGGAVARTASTHQANSSGYALPLPADVMNKNKGRFDAGVDYESPVPVPIYAIADGVIHNQSQSGYGFGPHYPVLTLDKPINGEVAIYYGHSISSIADGTHVSAGDQIGMTAGAGCTQVGCPKGHVEIGFWKASGGTYGHGPAGPKMGATLDSIAKGSPIAQKDSSGNTSSTGTGAGSSSGGFNSAGNGGGVYGGKDPIPWSQVRSEAKAVAFSALLEGPSLEDIAEARLLTGRKSLLNDKPLLPFVEQLCTASLRSFMSLPNGDFFAFYPDYFGGLGRQPYWIIDDIEILHGKIELSDDALATHVYVVGDTSAPFAGLGGDGIDWIDRVNSLGVMTIQDAFKTDFLNFDPVPGDPSNLRDKGKLTERALNLSEENDANIFLQKYGARPKLLEMPMIRNPWYELFMAYQTFCLMWSQQFLTDFTFTFMPELFPGGIVSFPDHGIQCYVDEVTHFFDYESGFTTQATLMAPAATQGAASHGVNVGMVRSGVLTGNTDNSSANPFSGSIPKGQFGRPKL